MYLLRTAPRRDLQINGLVDLDGMDFTTFYRSFRFQKGDLEDLMEALLIPEEVVSAQQVRVSGREALCMTLRRLAYPNRLWELELFFRRHSSVISSVVSKVLAHIDYYFAHLLADLTVHRWLNLQSLELFSQRIPSYEHATGIRRLEVLDCHQCEICGLCPTAGFGLILKTGCMESN
ncbi:hypothetical protein MRX96_045705 [Rhipicephalus microplus]